MRKTAARFLRRLARWLEPLPEAAPPTHDELSDNVTHVCYEVAAMERAAVLRVQGGRFRFEAFYLHARLLREFLWGTSSNLGPGATNSLLAEHYFNDTSDWRSIRGGLPPALAATKDRVDRQIAHLSRDRDSDFVDLEVEVPKVLSEITAQWKRFESLLPPQWAPRFTTELAARRAQLANNLY